VRELDPSVVVFARVGIVAAVLLPVAAQRKVLRQLRGRWFAIAALACVQIVGPFLLISYGEQHIASSLTSLLIAADPLLVALFALRFDPGERVDLSPDERRKTAGFCPASCLEDRASLFRQPVLSERAYQPQEMRTLAGNDRSMRSGSQAEKPMGCAHTAVHDDDQPCCFSFSPGLL
jgi:hypothetical protein